MKVSLAASPLPGLRGQTVCDIAREAWQAERPRDFLSCRCSSDGRAPAYSESGIYDVLGLTETVERGGPFRRLAAVGESKAALDYVELLPGPFCGDSSALGDDISWALARGVDEIIVALGVPGGIGDLGWAVIARLAGAEDLSGLSEARNGQAPAMNAPDLQQLIARAREALGTVHLSVVVGGRQRLLGMSGLARAWMREGLSASRAQETERKLGEAAERLVRTANAVPGRDLTGRPLSSRGPYSGAGGGLALGLEAVGGRIVRLSDLVHSRLEGWADEADLCVYVCGEVGEDLPEGLQGAIRRAQEEGLPIVLVYDSGSLRRGELARLGLNGAYEMRSERSFVESVETPESAAQVRERLDSTIRAVSRTWGW